MEIFQYYFMVRAFIVGILVSTMIPCVGSIMVNRRNSMIGDALSHTSLAGVSIGLIIGINPILGAIIVCVIAAFSMDILRGKFNKGTDIPTAIIMSTGIGLTAVLSDYLPGAVNFQSFLFGSIVAIPDFEFYLIIFISFIVLLVFISIYESLVFITFDEEGANVAGVNTKLVNTVFTVITALTISIASRTVGVLMISSLMVLPVATAIRISKSFFMTIIKSVILGISYTVLGIYISFYFGLKPGGVIVLIGVSALLVSIIIDSIKRKFNTH